MIVFPKRLSVVTFELPETDVRHEVKIQGSRLIFNSEVFYNREAISGKKDINFRGFRFALDMTFEQTTQHDVLREFWNDVVTEYNAGGEIRVFLKRESSIVGDDDYFEVTLSEYVADLAYRNQVGRHGYNMSFQGKVVVDEITGVDVSFVIVGNGDFVIDAGGNNIIVDIFDG